MRFPLQFQANFFFFTFTILRADKVLTLVELHIGYENQQSYIVVMHALIYHNLRHSQSLIEIGENLKSPSAKDPQ